MTIINKKKIITENDKIDDSQIKNETHTNEFKNKI